MAGEKQIDNFKNKSVGIQKKKGRLAVKGERESSVRHREILY